MGRRGVPISDFAGHFDRFGSTASRSDAEVGGRNDTPHSARSPRARGGFTLLEVLVASAIFIFLAIGVYLIFGEAQDIARIAQRRTAVYQNIGLAFDVLQEDLDLMQPLARNIGQLRFASTGTRADDPNTPFLEVRSKVLLQVQPVGGGPAVARRAAALVRYYLITANLEGPVLAREVLPASGMLAAGETLVDARQHLAQYIQDVRVEYLRRKPAGTIGSAPEAGYEQYWTDAPSDYATATALWPVSPAWDQSPSPPPPGPFVPNPDPAPYALRITMIFTDATANPARTPAILRVIARTFFLRANATQ